MDTQKTAPQTRQDDKVRWQLDGISAERQHIQARLQYLDQQEQELRGQAMTGTAMTAPTKRGKRTRKLSETQRQRQSEAAKARWARQREQKAKEAMAAAEAQGTTVPPRVETVDQVTA